MPLIKRFEDVKGWQEARELTQKIYQLTAQKPFSHDFELVGQIRSASASIMANVAEGFDCESKAEQSRFLGYARRSAVEVQSLLYVSLDAGFINKETFDSLYQQADKSKALIGGLKRSLDNQLKTTSAPLSKN
ncbi:MAG TPA: four helix bundle protein [Bellilinea sp.]|nr:four helix bundle protein [Bellilinea sp.]